MLGNREFLVLGAASGLAGDGLAVDYAGLGRRSGLGPDPVRRAVRLLLAEGAWRWPDPAEAEARARLVRKKRSRPSQARPAPPRVDPSRPDRRVVPGFVPSEDVRVSAAKLAIRLERLGPSILSAPRTAPRPPAPEPSPTEVSREMRRWFRRRKRSEGARKIVAESPRPRVAGHLPGP